MMPVMSTDIAPSLTPADAARILNMSRRKVYDLLHAGHLPGLKIEGTSMWRIPHADFVAYMAGEWRPAS